MTMAPVRAEQEFQLAQFSNDQKAILKATVAPDLTDNQLAFFGAVAQRLGLDPFLKQIYAWPDRKGAGGIAIHTGIDGLRLAAQATGEYAGQEGPFWCGADGAWKEFWDHKTMGPPAACKVGVWRVGAMAPAWEVVNYSEFFRPTKSGEGKWETMPAHMLSIRAEAHSLKKAFQNRLRELRMVEPEELPAHGVRIEEEPAPSRQTHPRAHQALKAGETRPSFSESAGAGPLPSPNDVGAVKMRALALLRQIGVPDPTKPGPYLSRAMGREFVPSKAELEDWRAAEQLLLITRETQTRAFAAYGGWCKQEGHDASDREFRLRCWAEVLGLSGLFTTGALIQPEFARLAAHFSGEADPFQDE